jgi:hypothetical protein
MKLTIKVRSSSYRRNRPPSLTMVAFPQDLKQNKFTVEAEPSDTVCSHPAFESRAGTLHRHPPSSQKAKTATTLPGPWLMLELYRLAM